MLESKNYTDDERAVIVTSELKLDSNYELISLRAFQFKFTLKSLI